MAPADLHDPSSIRTDTPAYHSPFISSRQIHQGSVNNTSYNQIKSPTASTFTFRTHRERLNDPAASGLDLDDDTRSSVASDIYDDSPPLGVGDSDDEEFRRMSYLGPKMRFHSRAPWEMDQQIPTEEDDHHSDHGNSYFSTSTKKNFVLSSPRSGNIRRPSAESTRSQPKSKQSFETTSSSNFSYPRGALYTLAQESLSATSLGPPPASQKVFRGKFSLNRTRPDSPPGSLIPSPTSSARSSENAPFNYHSPRHDSTDVHTSPHRQAAYVNDNFHPYANPDLVVSFEDQSPHPPSDESVAHNGSTSTVADSIIPTPLSRTETNSTLSPSVSITTTPVVNVKSRPSLVQGKGISLPVSNSGSDASPHHDEARSTSRQSRFDNIPGWTDRTTNPGFSLISLEEARAQRIRNNTVQPGTVHQTPFLLASSTDLPSGATFEYEDHGSLRSQRVRARSISAGATKAKTALHTLVGGGQTGREPEPMPSGSSGKTLKHRKSGFMRLFNAARTQEKEDKHHPPPVPPIPDPQAEYEAPKATTHRVPVPELPLYPLASSSSAEASPTLEPPSTTTPRRLHPPLSINTRAPSYANRPPSTFRNDPLEAHAATATSAPSLPWLVPSAPKSAPADVSEFPSLKLRPVSTLFSAHFEDHIIPNESRPSLETDVGTPSSLTKVHSPMTPGFAFRSDLDKASTFTTTVPENQASIISALQDQISSNKLAWQQQVRELESQVRDLKLQLDSLRQAEIERSYCETCGRGHPPSSATSSLQDGKNMGIMNRPRARTGTSSRFGSAA